MVYTIVARVASAKVIVAGKNAIAATTPPIIKRTLLIACPVSDFAN
ncbi:hypothetical protein LEP1GSC110_0379 [Leptospira interrogans serovar Medanensis str. UT053]|nr:hypothetical protein LEP1GSC110_0379 [Leptospira interrogans serovar Medanensis str. UT053]